MKKELKQDYVLIKLTSKEKQVLKEKADKLGMNTSQYIRTKCIYN